MHRVQLVPQVGVLRKGFLIHALQHFRRGGGGRDGENHVGVHADRSFRIDWNGAAGGIDQRVGQVIKGKHRQHAAQIALRGLLIGAGGMEENHHALTGVGGAVVRRAGLHRRKFVGDLLHKRLSAKGSGKGQRFFFGLVVGDGGAFAGVVHVHARIGKLLTVGLLLVTAHNDQIRLQRQHGFDVQAAHAGGDHRQILHPVGIIHRGGGPGHSYGMNIAAHQNLQRRVGQADDAFRHFGQRQRFALALLQITRVIQRLFAAAFRARHGGHRQQYRTAQYKGKHFLQHTCCSPFSSWVMSNTRSARSL